MIRPLELRTCPTRRSSELNRETEGLAKLFEEYEKALRKANALDFDDLLLEAVRLLRHDTATRTASNNRSSTSRDRKSTGLNSSHRCSSYACFVLKKKPPRH